MTTIIAGYTEDDYLEGPYLTNHAQEITGMQAQFAINSEKDVGMQALFSIVDYEKPIGMQSDFSIVDYEKPSGMQTEFVINYEKPIGVQAEMQIIDFERAEGMQAQAFVLDYDTAYGSNVRVDKYPTLNSFGYLEADYLMDPYLTEINTLVPGMQAEFHIVDYENATGMQSELEIVDREVPNGMQAEFHIVDFEKATGMQAEAVSLSVQAMQVLATLYNTKNLRMLCDFPSRGLTSSNWTANSTEPGDFSVQNLDTDIVEQVWRSATGVVTGIHLDTDTGLPQGVFLDTFAALGHNLTKSAIVNLIGSDNPAHAPTGVVIPIEVTQPNMYYIAPTLPNTGYRYWRLEIDDVTNPDGHLQIGIILFGAAKIFQGECFVDEIEFELKDFADTVKTEGFTNVANSRTQKRRLRLEFRSLQLQKQNFQNLRDMFKRDRTTLKCLWIPTPSETDQNVTDRFAVYGKLTQVPVERHNNKGPDADYVSFTIEVDESL